MLKFQANDVIVVPSLPVEKLVDMRVFLAFSGLKQYVLVHAESGRPMGVYDSEFIDRIGMKIGRWKRGFRDKLGKYVGEVVRTYSIEDLRKKKTQIAEDNCLS
jgi:hypothetical protein